MQQARRYQDREFTRQIEDLQKTVTNLATSFETYAPTLKRISEDHLYWSRIREALIVGTAKSLLVVLAMAVAGAIGWAMRDYLVQLVSITTKR